MSATSVHRPPVFPHLWLLWFAGAHVLLAALWWTWGWQAAIPVWLGSHGLLLCLLFSQAAALFQCLIMLYDTQAAVDNGHNAILPTLHQTVIKCF